MTGRPVVFRRFPQVKPITGEFGCYLVQSSSRLRLWHRVDMLENRGNGWCGCEHFGMRIQPLLDRGEKPALWLECRHLQAVRHYSAVELWTEIAKKLGVKDEERKRRNREANKHAEHEELEETEAA